MKDEDTKITIAGVESPGLVNLNESDGMEFRLARARRKKSLEAIQPAPWDANNLSPDPVEDLISFSKLRDWKPEIYTIKHVGDEPPRRMRIDTDNAHQSGYVGAVLAAFTFTPAWPWEAPSLRIAFGVPPGGSAENQCVVVTIALKVKHAQQGHSINIEQSFMMPEALISDPAFVKHEFAKALESMFVHEFYESVLFGGKHVTEPHQPVTMATFKFVVE